MLRWRLQKVMISSAMEADTKATGTRSIEATSKAPQEGKREATGRYSLFFAVVFATLGAVFAAVAWLLFGSYPKWSRADVLSTIALAGVIGTGIGAVFGPPLFERWLNRGSDDLDDAAVTNISHQYVTNVAHQTVSLPPARLEVIRQLPDHLPEFTGREDILAQMRVALGAGTPSRNAWSRIALHGPPGVGKSVLAIHAAHEISAGFPDGQLCVNLAGDDGSRRIEPGEALAAFLRALGVRDAEIPAATAERAAWYRSLLASRRALVFLDNARDELQVRPLLPGAGSVVLITSQEPLAGLEGCWSRSVPVLARNASLEMLGKLIGSERVEHEFEQADRIADLCGDLPLALRIAGGLLGTRPTWGLERVTALLADEQTRLRRLEVGDLSVRATFSVAYELLPAPQKRLFRMLGVLRGHVARNFAAGFVASFHEEEEWQAEDSLGQLVDAHLLEFSHRGYTMHNLIRLYARERFDLEESDELGRKIWQAEARYYIGVDLAKVAQVSYDHGQEFAARSDWDWAIRAFQRSVEQCREVVPPDRHGEAKALIALANIYELRERSAEAIETLRESATALSAANDPTAEHAVRERLRVLMEKRSG